MPKINFLFSLNQINGTQAIYATYSDYVLFHLRDEACMLIPSMCSSGGTVLFWTYLPPSCGAGLGACGIVSTIRTRFTSGFHLYYQSSVIAYVSTKVTYFNKIILFLLNPLFKNELFIFFNVWWRISLPMCKIFFFCTLDQGTRP